MSSLHTQLYEQVFDAILGGKISPGTRLSEQKLAEIYGVSRSVVRRTLQRLCDEGIVDIRQNRGATVVSVDAVLARQIFESRRVVELGIVELVCGHLHPSNVKEMRELCAQEQNAMQSGHRARGLRLSAEFHLLLAKATKNKLLESIAGNLMSRSALAIACLERHPPIHCAWGEHNAIIDALGQGDLTTAKVLMTAHLEHIALNLQIDEDEVVLEQLFVP